MINNIRKHVILTKKIESSGEKKMMYIKKELMSKKRLS